MRAGFVLGRALCKNSVSDVQLLCDIGTPARKEFVHVSETPSRMSGWRRRAATPVSKNHNGENLPMQTREKVTSGDPEKDRHALRRDSGATKRHLRAIRLEGDGILERSRGERGTHPLEQRPCPFGLDHPHPHRRHATQTPGPWLLHSYAHGVERVAENDASGATNSTCE